MVRSGRFFAHIVFFPFTMSKPSFNKTDWKLSIAAIDIHEDRRSRCSGGPIGPTFRILRFLPIFYVQTKFHQNRLKIRHSCHTISRSHPNERPEGADRFCPFSIPTLLFKNQTSCKNFIQIGLNLLKLSWHQKNRTGYSRMDLSYMENFKSKKF